MPSPPEQKPWLTYKTSTNIFNNNDFAQQDNFLKIANSHLMMMLRAPRGVTNIAGANAYAAKFATSPTTTENISESLSSLFTMYVQNKFPFNKNMC